MTNEQKTELYNRMWNMDDYQIETLSHKYLSLDRIDEYNYVCDGLMARLKRKQDLKDNKW